MASRAETARGRGDGAVIITRLKHVPFPKLPRTYIGPKITGIVSGPNWVLVKLKASRGRSEN